MDDDKSYRDLSDKIGRVEITMTEKLGEVLGSVRELSATMRSGLDQIGAIRADMEKVKEKATKAEDSTNSAHKRLDEMKHIKDANLVERVRDLEASNRKLVWTVLGALITGSIGLLFFFAKGGG